MPNARSSTSAEEEKHFHNWEIDPRLPSQEYCRAKFKGQPCKNLRISETELKGREEAWKNYFNLVKHSWAFNRFKYMQAAWRRKDFPKMQKLAEEAKNRIGRNEYLIKPDFPNPLTWNNYEIC